MSAIEGVLDFTKGADGRKLDRVCNGIDEVALKPLGATEEFELEGACDRFKLGTVG